RQFDPALRQTEAARASVEQALARLPRPQALQTADPARTLVDGMWFNANYWYRVGLARVAFGTAKGQEIGLLGPHSASRSKQTMARLGISETRSFARLMEDASTDARRMADAAVAAVITGDDILGLDMPGGLPADIVYDGILKRQRAASV